MPFCSHYKNSFAKKKQKKEKIRLEKKTNFL